MTAARMLTLEAPTGERFAFDPGALCLSLVTTGGQAERAVFETLHTPGDLDRWLSHTTDLEVDASEEQDLVEMKELREAIWQAANARIDETGLPAPAVDVLNRRAAHPPPAPAIDRDAQQRWQAGARTAHAAALLARDAIDLLAGPRSERLRRCEAHDCTLLFVDTSRPGRRRWCSMQRCGNRAKVRAFRQRQHQEEASP